MDQEQREPSNTGTLQGWGLILLGLGFIGYCILWPWWQIQQKAPEIDFYGEGGFVGIAALFFGIAKLIAPHTAESLLKMDQNNLKKKDIAILLAVGILTVAVAVGVDFYFKSKGYH